MAGSIMLSDPQRSNLKEIFRHIATESQQEVINLNRYGAETITNWYVQQYPEDFQQKGGNSQIVYMKGDKTKSSATDTEEIEETDNGYSEVTDDEKLDFEPDYPDRLTDSDGDPDDGDDGDDGESEKMTFSMSSGPPSNDDE